MKGWRTIALFCSLIGHRKSFCPAPPPPGPDDMYGVSLRSYVYLRTHSPPSSQLVCILGGHRSLLCIEDLGLVFFLPAPSAGSTTTMRPPRCSPFKLVEEASFAPGFHLTCESRDNMTPDLDLIRRHLSSQTWTCLKRGRANLLIVRISCWVLIQTWPTRA